MKKRNHSSHEEEENSERWLLTYADMITLLLALFIILYAISNVNAQKFQEIADAASQAYSPSQNASPKNQAPSEKTTEIGEADEVQLQEVYNMISSYIDEHSLDASLSIEVTDNYVRIQVKDNLMFQPNTANLYPKSLAVINDLATMVSLIYDQADYITFSGHIADVGDHSLQDDLASWRLSTERALTVLTEFVNHGIPQDKLSIQGFSYFSPVDTSGTEEGLARNRRVDITIYKYPDSSTTNIEHDVLENSTGSN